MREIPTRFSRFYSTLIGFGVLLLLLAVVAGRQWWRLKTFNRAVSNGELSLAAAVAPLQQQRFLRAFSFERAGDLATASEHYAQLRSSAPEDLWAAARFNLAGVYLQQAVETELSTHQEGRAVLIELAKWHYRELLRERPDDRALTHNLAVALALQPDVLATAAPELDEMPDRSPQAPVSATGRERLP
ncbi:MAG: hypothetical protein ACPGSC_14450 [Granulosicoccaceae bacterium]